MKTVEEYIKYIEEYKKNMKAIDDDTLIRYVFIDLSKRLSFNLEYRPFGSRKRKKEIYNSICLPGILDECMERKTVICNQAAYLMVEILRPFGIKIRVEKETVKKELAHSYNVITRLDGTEYIVDLQEDMYRVKMHGKTPNYGISPKTRKYVISQYKQEQMDRDIKYITSDNYYTDEYIYFLKDAISNTDSMYEKIKFVLEHIEPFKNLDINYMDRQWYHVKVLEQLFSMMVFNYEYGGGIIKFLDCYKKTINGRYCVQCILVRDEKAHIFLYNPKEFGYKEISIDNFSNAVYNGLIIHNGNIREVEEKIRIKRRNSITCH